MNGNFINLFNVENDNNIKMKSLNTIFFILNDRQTVHKNRVDSLL